MTRPRDSMISLSRNTIDVGALLRPCLAYTKTILWMRLPALQVITFQRRREGFHFCTSLHQFTSDASFRLKSSKSFIQTILQKVQNRILHLKKLVFAIPCLLNLELPSKKHFKIFSSVLNIEILTPHPSD